MAVALEQFVKQLAESGVISPDKLARYVPPQAHPKDAQELAREIVKAKLLTKYQSQEIYVGRARGLTLGNYTILDKIGAGGMGQVFKAEHRRMKRVVALKMLPASVTKDPAAVARFQREVEAAARLRHTNIVAADDADEAGGIHFLVMEYVDGKDLSAIVKQNGPLPVAEAVECIRQAAQGLAYAHKRGVIHRDIKPANLLLDSDGTVKILDMGLARLEGQLADAASVAGLTQSGQVMGTVDYMSPEQAEETHGVDARADQYSLGCSLWVLLVGRPMFGGTTTIAKLMAHRTQPAPSLRSARADVPEALDNIYQRMVAKEPGERFAGMDEVIAALAACFGEAASTQIDGSSSSDSRLTEFFKQIGGIKTAAPPRSTTAVDAETIQHQPVQDDTGTAHIGKPQPSSTSLAPAPTTRLGAKRHQLHPLTMMAALAVGGLSVVGGLLALLLWLVLPGGQSDSGAPADADPAHPAMAIAPFDEAAAKKHQQAWADYLGEPVERDIELPGGETLTMVLIPPGTFAMGETGKSVEVTLTQPFWLGQTEVTRAQWEAVMQTRPWGGQEDLANGGDLPATPTTWSSAAKFCEQLTQQQRAAGRLPGGCEFRLPTEAQWEFACRAGTATAYIFGDTEQQLGQYAWYGANTKSVKEVAKKLPNRWGLYDMHGNVGEWCRDFYQQELPGGTDPEVTAWDNTRVCRGGGRVPPHGDECRSAARTKAWAGTPQNGVGFRVVCTIASMAAAPKPPLAPAENYALDFDGKTAYVEIPTLKLPDGPLTVEAWITPRNTDDAPIFVAGGESYVSLQCSRNHWAFGAKRRALSTASTIDRSSPWPAFGMASNCAPISTAGREDRSTCPRTSAASQHCSRSP